MYRITENVFGLKRGSGNMLGEIFKRYDDNKNKTLVPKL